jgi:hypothetical protein
MKSIFLVIVTTATYIACDNNSETATNPTNTATVKTVDSSSAAVAVQSTSSFPSDLTLEETKDDAVFTDGSEPTSWDNAGIDDPVAFKKFLKKLQGWVANNQRDSVAAAIAFPLLNSRVRNKEQIIVKDKNEFLANYDLYINDTVKAALKNQNLRQVFRNANGAMVGNGQLWLGQVENGFAIMAINNK